MKPFVEFLSSNREIKYPFKESVLLPSIIPLDLIVDITINSDSDLDQRFFLSKIVKSPTEIELHINDLFFFTAAIGPTDAVYSFQNSLFLAKIVVGNSNVNLLNGEYTFTIDQTEFEHSAVAQNIRRLRSLEARDFTFVKDDVLSGDISLSPGFNVSLSSDEEDNSIQIDIARGFGLGQPPCSHDREAIQPIKEINNRVTEDGNFFINGSQCIEIINVPNCPMIVVHDKCQPCCLDCDVKLDGITTSITDLGDPGSIDSQIDDLDTRITALEP